MTRYESLSRQPTSEVCSRFSQDGVLFFEQRQPLLQISHFRGPVNGCVPVIPARTFIGIRLPRSVKLPWMNGIVHDLWFARPTEHGLMGFRPEYNSLYPTWSALGAAAC